VVKKFNIPLVAEGLITYAVERQIGMERPWLEGAPPWAERRRFCADAVLRGMAELDGLPPDPKFLERYDKALEQAKHGALGASASPQMQKEIGQNFMRYVSALERAGGDNRHRIAAVRELAQDIATHHPWARSKILFFESVICTAGDILKRMTAERPIRFTYFTLSGGFDPPNHISDFVSGTVNDVEAAKATELYQRVTEWRPNAPRWRAHCEVYVCGNADHADTVADADDFDMSIIREDEYRFLKQPGIRCVDGWELEIPVYEMIKALRVAPGAAPKAVVIPNTLKRLQTEVGGCIKTLGLNRGTCLICNEEGKLMGLPANRQVGGNTIAGTFLIVGEADGEFCSLTDADAAHYAEEFAQPLPSHSGPDEPTQWTFYVF
jgi:hypothetical protein